MRTLPFDYARCNPTDPDANCRNCKRWYHHPEQVNGPRTAVVYSINSADAACIYIPASLLGKEV